ncbi:MAG: DivIVA domain-containing protein [Spirosomataceae bacterium]
MKITPIEIRQHSFQRVLRGYDAEEVTAFLTSLSNEWERVLNENKMLKMQLEIAEKELNKLREVELTMFRMLKTAEDTSAQMTEQAKNAAEHYIEEARQKGEEVINEARKKSNMLIMDAENQAKYVREEIMGEFKSHERDFKAMEKYRDNLVVQLKTLANNTVDSIERFEKKFSQNTVKEKIEDLKHQMSEALKTDKENNKANAEEEQSQQEPTEVSETATSAQENESVVSTSENASEEHTASSEATADASETEPTAESEASDETKKEEKKSQDEGSFFDQI